MTSVLEATARECEERAFEIAYDIAIIGGSNPVGCAKGLWDVAKLLREAGLDSKGVEQHAAYRAVAGHLAFLADIGLGPPKDVLDAVNARRIGATKAYTLPQNRRDAADMLAKLGEALNTQASRRFDEQRLDIAEYVSGASRVISAWVPFLYSGNGYPRDHAEYVSFAKQAEQHAASWEKDPCGKPALWAQGAAAGERIASVILAHFDL